MVVLAIDLDPQASRRIRTTLHDQEETAVRTQAKGPIAYADHQSERHARTGGAGVLLSREASQAVAAATLPETQTGLTEMTF